VCVCVYNSVYETSALCHKQLSQFNFHCSHQQTG